METITAWSPESAETVAMEWWRWGLLLLFPEGWFLKGFFGYVGRIGNNLIPRNQIGRGLQRIGQIQVIEISGGGVASHWNQEASWSLWLERKAQAKKAFVVPLNGKGIAHHEERWGVAHRHRGATAP